MKNIRRQIKLSRKNSEWFCSSKSNFEKENGKGEDDEDFEKYKLPQNKRSSVEDDQEKRPT